MNRFTACLVFIGLAEDNLHLQYFVVKHPSSFAIRAGPVNYGARSPSARSLGPPRRAAWCSESNGVLPRASTATAAAPVGRSQTGYAIRAGGDSDTGFAIRVGGDSY